MTIFDPRIGRSVADLDTPTLLLDDFPDVEIPFFLSEEHVVVRNVPDWSIGQMLHLIPGHACTPGRAEMMALEPMVGVIHLSLGAILERIRRGIDLGVRQFQISLPSWGALNDRELFDFFERVCGPFPDCRFMHYNLPRVKRLVTGTEYGRLADTHPKLVATKNTGDSLSHLRSLLDDAPQLQHFLSEAGDDEYRTFHRRLAERLPEWIPSGPRAN